MNNGAAIGYAMIAARDMGLSEDQVQLLGQKMYDEMDYTSEKRADEVYCGHPLRRHLIADDDK